MSDNFSIVATVLIVALAIVVLFSLCYNIAQRNNEKHRACISTLAENGYDASEIRVVCEASAD